MSPEVYRLIHIFGILLVFGALGAVNLHVANGGTRETNRWRGFVAITHGAGMLLILVAGFGLLARLGLMEGGMPGWIWGKLAIWLVLGAALTISYRKPEWARVMWWAVPVLGGVAAWLAFWKPF